MRPLADLFIHRILRAGDLRLFRDWKSSIPPSVVNRILRVQTPKVCPKDSLRAVAGSDRAARILNITSNAPHE